MDHGSLPVMRRAAQSCVSFLMVATLGSACIVDDQPEVDPRYKGICERYCSSILTCDPDQFDEHFPSVPRCEAACSYALIGEGGANSPACTEALIVTVRCVGDLSCDEFYSGGCQAEHAAQAAICESP